MNGAYLGIDTSNYTTSAALYDPSSGCVVSKKKLLPVQKAQCGLRQSDAVFLHVKQLPEVICALRQETGYTVRAVCASSAPRPVDGSYMPAFLVGMCVAQSAALLLNVPYYTCSHQEGHIMAALYSADALSLRSAPFYAFHVSGGTTECLSVIPNETGFLVEKIAGTLDLNAGQLVDRVGVMLGMGFPCGMELDRLAQSYEGKLPPIRVPMKGADCHFSGAQNQCEKLHASGAPDAMVARYAISYIGKAVDNMTAQVLAQYGQRPVVYAGGVMSNSMIRAWMQEKYDGYFAAPAFSSDNAAGVALIGALKDQANE